MKRLTFVLALALALGVQTVTFAQARPDFSGTWRYNQSKSNPNTSGNTPNIAFPSQIVVKQTNPWWFPPTQDSWAAGAKPVPPGPGNPLGTRWMGLSAPGVGIHGTSEPWSIGHSESHGCIRMQIAAAEWLFNRVRIGTPVFIVPA